MRTTARAANLPCRHTPPATGASPIGYADRIARVLAFARRSRIAPAVASPRMKPRGWRKLASSVARKPAQLELKPDPGKLVSAMVAQRNPVMLAVLQKLAGAPERLMFGGKFLRPQRTLPPAGNPAWRRHLVIDDSIAHRPTPIGTSSARRTSDAHSDIGKVSPPGPCTLKRLSDPRTPDDDLDKRNCATIIVAPVWQRESLCKSKNVTIK